MEKMQKMEIKIQQAAEGMIYIGMSIVFELQMQPLFNAIIVFWGDIYWDLFHLLFFLLGNHSYVHINSRES